MRHQTRGLSPCESSDCFRCSSSLPCSPHTRPGSPAAADDKPVAKGKDDKDRELHVVGISGGFTKSDGKIHGGKRW